MAEEESPAENTEIETGEEPEENVEKPEENVEKPKENVKPSSESERPSHKKDVAPPISREAAISADIKNNFDLCVAECKVAHQYITEAKAKIVELTNKTDRTPEEDKELVDLQTNLRLKMSSLEKKRMNLIKALKEIKPSSYQPVYDEDFIPQIVVFGPESSATPQFMVCGKKPERRIDPEKEKKMNKDC